MIPKSSKKVKEIIDHTRKFSFHESSKFEGICLFGTQFLNDISEFEICNMKKHDPVM